MSRSADIPSQSETPRRFLAQPFETSSWNSNKGYQRMPNSTDTELLNEAAEPESNSPSGLHARAGTVSHRLSHDSSLSKPCEGNVSCSYSKSLGDHQPHPISKWRVRRPLPEPIETTKTNKRRVELEPRLSLGDNDRLQIGPRKFEPQLIETNTRSFRKGEPSRNLDHDSISNILSEHSNQVNTHQCAGQPTRAAVHAVPESKFSYTNLLRRQETRRHSYRVPDLPAIPSNSSEVSDGSGPPSLSTSPSASSGASPKPSKVTDRRRESCDEKVSGYLLSLAARSAEKQLKEQALAAFPNEQVYQPVDHFAIDREDESSNEGESPGCTANQTSHRRASSVDLSWELEYMRQHKEEAVMRNRAVVESQESQFSCTAMRAHPDFHCAEYPEGFHKESARTRHGASPPMLGNDLIFPQSLSPETTLCESATGISRLQDKYQKYCGGLWSADLRQDSKRGGGGLWMGTCGKVELNHKSQDKLLPGVVTPIHYFNEESRMCLDGINTTAKHLDQQTSTPLNQDAGFDYSIPHDSGKEFHDGVVTQIYNYLSLGYPCVARYYDSELSKISGISVEELRRDDLNTDARGYFGVTENTKANGRTCMRWAALRLYIHEWIKQQPRMMENDSNCEAWGVRERRGSWAV
ncbi:hypothetical protein ASPWEDRAFT_46794 [Aspergillus wentii DTO 134E9]|uniref:Uncharacterized protein n=1 Tax=Aspergillus wentii DTO 134E9 TaxID=1073089 RepID=A0A1L9R593_ASPWE|nr:uncharacterized protein ASPWEDRAFT_46794 [Aspergillus wentii DTO 134E9]KAI9927328.1 hypothetical protein MW887_003715 [Aspergillus wentii]OJJ30057.1 hypothetical protein ASPWEDRAFT_46794 [Aspergillus wentii DTO 134E9]